MRLILQLIRIFINDTAKFKDIKNSDNAEKSVYFGVVGILSGILGCAVSTGLIFGGILLIEGATGSGNVFAAIFLVIIGAALSLGGALGFIMCSIRGIIASAYQLRLKRKATGAVSLILNLAVLIAAVILIVSIIT